MNNDAFGKFVCDLRKEKGLTQQQLAEQLHLTNKAISKWERGLSFPDILVLEKLSAALDVSILELLSGERKIEGSVEKEEVEKLLARTMKTSLKKERHEKKKYLAAFLAIVVLFVAVLAFRRNLFNYTIGVLTDLFETVHHSCTFDVKRSNSTDVAGCYVYEEIVDEETGRYDYHVMAIDSNEIVSQLFVLEETGMRLDRSPKLIYGDDCIFILFEGLDNEDPVEQLYNHKIGADPQAFLPHLFKYTFSTGEVEQVEIKDPSHSLLLDAFSYGDKTIYLSQLFKGVLGGLDVGFYRSDKLYSNLGNGIKYDTIIGDGGMKTTGCLLNNAYYIAGLAGIYQIDLGSGNIRLIREIDLSSCYRSEIQSIAFQNGKRGLAIVNGLIDEVDELSRPKALKTIVTLYDEDLKAISQTTLDLGASSIEWGDQSVIVSDLDAGKYKSLLIDLNTMETKTVVSADPDEIGNYSKGVRWQEEEEYHLDFLERCTSQWVYLHGLGKFVFTAENKLQAEESQ